MARFVPTKWFWVRVVLAIITLSLVVVELLAGRGFLVFTVQVLCIAGIIATSVADAIEQRRRSTR
jgi:4-hydroxybenzoate polyprenyltransferase